jgi:hypothetical protein
MYEMLAIKRLFHRDLTSYVQGDRELTRDPRAPADLPPGMRVALCRRWRAIRNGRFDTAGVRQRDPNRSPRSAVRRHRTIVEAAVHRLRRRCRRDEIPLAADEQASADAAHAMPRPADDPPPPIPQQLRRRARRAAATASAGGEMSACCR